jgi:hypothetical protein
MTDEYKWMVCETRRSDGQRANFDFGYSLHKTRKAALLKIETMVRWQKRNRNRMYINEW